MSSTITSGIPRASIDLTPVNKGDVAAALAQAEQNL